MRETLQILLLSLSLCTVNAGGGGVEMEMVVVRRQREEVSHTVTLCDHQSLFALSTCSIQHALCFLLWSLRSG